MDTLSDNRRTRMTKRLMKDALLELLEREKLVNISVTALCEAADVHRSTFYKHYSDPADVLGEIEQDFLDKIPVLPTFLDEYTQEQILSSAAAFFDYSKENKKILRILFNKSSGSNFAARLVEFLCSGIPLEKSIDEVSAHYMRLYIAYGTVGMMREWVTGGFSVSSERLAKMLYFLSTSISINNLKEDST